MGRSTRTNGSCSLLPTETLLSTEAGNIAMKDIPLGIKLKNGSRVCAVMRISNIDETGEQIEKVYKVEGGENNEPIFVSGSHLVYEPEMHEFVMVKNLHGAKPSIVTDTKCEEFACLITSDHTIPIGEWVFHDWEDNNGSRIKNYLVSSVYIIQLVYIWII